MKKLKCLKRMLRTTVLSMLMACVLLFVSCSAKPSGPEELLDFGFKDAVGKTIRETCTILGMEEDSLQQAKTTEYYLEEPIVYEGLEFSQYLMFTSPDGVLYAGGYDHRTTNDGEFADKVERIKAKLTEKYGEPITYPEVSTRFVGITDFSQYSSAEFREEWSAKEDNAVIVMMLQFFPEGEARITVSYRATKL